MHVLVIGANGKTGRKVVQQLANSNQHIVRAMIRLTEQQEDMEKLGAKPIIADLEQDFSYALNDVNAVIFAAGSGSHTGPEKTIAVDQEGAIKAVQYAKEKGIERFVMLSSMGAGNPEAISSPIQHYLIAKQKADQALVESSLDYTIVRPGALTDDPGTGSVTTALAFQSVGPIPREDVASVLVESLTTPEASGKIFEVVSGDIPIEHALKNLP
ncbi:MAG TPA: SDR family oxidoreductase [Chondromyces sp.]|nr:SDR family oxidoreductase [Chondromyces sp.]